MKQKLFQMYAKESIGNNQICKECRGISNVETMAQSPYLISHSSSEKNILFIGKLARGDSFGEKVTEYFEDVTSFGNEFIRNSSWAFYSYTREIMEQVFGSLEEGLNFVSFANIVKCNDNSTRDTTDYNAKEHCIRKNGFIWKEIAILDPRKIVFYTGNTYDNFLDEYRPEGCTSYVDVSDRHYTVSLRNKHMPWWERNFQNVRGEMAKRFLRVGHPERGGKKEFVELISAWLK